MLSLETVLKFLNAFKVWFFGEVIAHTEAEFIDLIGEHRALQVQICFDHNRARDKSDFFAFDMLCQARGPRGTRVTYRKFAGYISQASWGKLDKFALAKIREWDVELAQEIAGVLYARYHGITITTPIEHGEGIVDRSTLHRHRQLTLV